MVIINLLFFLYIDLYINIIYVFIYKSYIIYNNKKYVSYKFVLPDDLIV